MYGTEDCQIAIRVGENCSGDEKGYRRSIVMNGISDCNRYELYAPWLVRPECLGRALFLHNASWNSTWSPPDKYFCKTAYGKDGSTYNKGQYLNASSLRGGYPKSRQQGSQKIWKFRGHHLSIAPPVHWRRRGSRQRSMSYFHECQSVETLRTLLLPGNWRGRALPH